MEAPFHKELEVERSMLERPRRIDNPKTGIHIPWPVALSDNTYADLSLLLLFSADAPKPSGDKRPTNTNLGWEEAYVKLAKALLCCQLYFAFLTAFRTYNPAFSF